MITHSQNFAGGRIVTAIVSCFCNPTTGIKWKVFTILFLLIASAFPAGACNATPETTGRPGQEYVPLQKGFFRGHQVKEIMSGTPAYELKNLVADAFPDEEGDYTDMIHQGTGTGVQAAWKNTFTGSVPVTAPDANEANLAYVVLQFPLQEGVVENGNAYNPMINTVTNTHADDYRVQGEGVMMDVNGLRFPDCLQVEQEDKQERMLFFDRRIEVYARTTGLIVKAKTEWQYCMHQDRHDVGQQLVDKGRIYTQHIQEYGRE